VSSARAALKGRTVHLRKKVVEALDRLWGIENDRERNFLVNECIEFVLYREECFAEFLREKGLLVK